MFAKPISKVRAGIVIALVATATAAPGAAFAADAAMTPEAAMKDVEATMGGVPGFIKALPPAALPGAWAELKAIELSPDTALSAKEKSLISLAVAAQIPCQYCIYADTHSARQAGATDEEIAEAVTMAALARHWSTIFNGLQIDFDQFKKEFDSAMAVGK
jgi:AhpD family alkylhydroperoxidase